MWTIVFHSILAVSVAAARVKIIERNSTRLHGAVAGGAQVDVKEYVGPKAKTKVKPLSPKGRARGPTNLGGKENTNKITSSRNFTHTGECGSTFSAPDRAIVRCPLECPLMRFHPTMMCHWRCISEQECRSFDVPGVIDRGRGYCYVCAVPGCESCFPDRQVCSVCREGFELRSGECQSTSGSAWTALVVVVGVFAAIALIYIVNLAWRPVLSPNALAWGLEHRTRVKARAGERDHEMYSLDMSLADELTSAGGIGALLHFSWQRMVLWWSVTMTALSAAVIAYHGRLVAADVFTLGPPHDEMEGICSERLDFQEEEEFEAMRIHILISTGLMYVGSSAGAILWAWWQQRKYQRHADEDVSMEDYALLCSGFPLELEGDPPRDVTVRLEDEYKRYFVSAWGDSVIGVSIAWNMDDDQEKVTQTVANIVFGLENDRKQLERSGVSFFNTPVAASRSRSPWTCFLEPARQMIDSILWGDVSQLVRRNEPVEDSDSVSGRDEASAFPRELVDDAQLLLKGIPTAGFCFVVFRTEQDKWAGFRNPLPKFRGEHNIAVEQPGGDAEVVLWDNFTTSKSQRRRNMVVGFLQILCVIAVWTLCFWAPYTLYILSWIETGGASQGHGHIALMIGMLVTVGNQIVYAACGMVADHAKFTCRDDRDTFYTGLYTFSVLTNTVLDLWLVSIMARGWKADVAVDPEALVRVPSMQHAVFVQLALYLWPGCLLIPFVLEPLVLNVCPYFVAKWLVRSRPSCSKLEAEDCLTPPLFDLVRYGDNLINIVMICCFTYLTALKLWWAFMVLTVSLLFIYLWDCYRFKRGTCRTHFATNDIDVLANYIMAIPCAILAGGFIFKIAGGQGMVREWDRHTFLEEHPEIWAQVGAGILGHLLVHCMILYFIVPRCVTSNSRQEGAKDKVPYEQTAATVCCNWFNSNPVHCIRSHYLYQHEPSHVFYQPGRDYLHRRNTRPEDSDALIIYESQVFEKEAGVWEDLKTTKAFKAASGRMQMFGRSGSSLIGGSIPEESTPRHPEEEGTPRQPDSASGRMPSTSEFGA
jgi:hypothetical protein